MNQVKEAIQKLKDTNWLNREVTDESVDEAAKQVVEVTNNTTSTMLEKASENEIGGFKSFMIRNLDNCTVASGVSAYEVCTFESAVCTRQVTCCLESPQ